MSHNDDSITGHNSNFSIVPNQMPELTADEQAERDFRAAQARNQVTGIPVLIAEHFQPPALRHPALQQAIEEGAGMVAEALTREFEHQRAEKVTAVMRNMPDRFWRIMCDAMDAFAEANAEYGEFAHDDLGLASQWEHMYRKVKKLRSDMWIGEPKLTRETPQVVLRDIIGHCMLALDLYERGFNGGKH